VVDPVNGRIIAQHIAIRFANLTRPTASLSDEFEKIHGHARREDREWMKLLAPFKGQEVVSYHNAWIYFAERFGLKMDCSGTQTGHSANPAHLADVITKMKAAKAHVIIVDAYLNRRTAETVARNTGATVVDVSQFPGGVKGTDGGYIALLDYLVNALAKALGDKK